MEAIAYKDGMKNLKIPVTPLTDPALTMKFFQASELVVLCLFELGIYGTVCMYNDQF